MVIVSRGAGVAWGASLAERCCCAGQFLVVRKDWLGKFVYGDARMRVAVVIGNVVG